MAASCPRLQWLGTYLQTDGRRHQPGWRNIHSPRTPRVYIYTAGPEAQRPGIIQYPGRGWTWGGIKIILVNLHLTDTPSDSSSNSSGSSECPMCRPIMCCHGSSALWATFNTRHSRLDFSRCDMKASEPITCLFFCHRFQEFNCS